MLALLVHCKCLRSSLATDRSVFINFTAAAVCDYIFDSSVFAEGAFTLVRADSNLCSDLPLVHSRIEHFQESLRHFNGFDVYLCSHGCA